MSRLSAVAEASSVPNDLEYVDRSLAIACTRGREAVVSRFRTLLRRENLSEQQWRILRLLFDDAVLSREPQLTSVDIATRSCIHKVSVSRIIRSLEVRGLIGRTASLEDARASYVKLTSAGYSYMQPLVHEAAAIHHKIAEDLSFENYNLLLKLLRQLSEI